MMKTKECSSDLSIKDNSRKATGGIAGILYELYQLEREFLQQIIALDSLDDADYDDARYVVDELIEALSLLTRSFNS